MRETSDAQGPASRSQNKTKGKRMKEQTRILYILTELNLIIMLFLFNWNSHTNTRDTQSHTYTRTRSPTRATKLHPFLSLSVSLYRSVFIHRSAISYSNTLVRNYKYNERLGSTPYVIVPKKLRNFSNSKVLSRFKFYVTKSVAFLS